MQRVTLAPIRADINVTPLVDVVLVLLIIFMVVTPLITDRVRLPQTLNPAARQARPERLLITLDRNHGLWIDGEAVAAPRLGERLGRIYAVSPRKDVVVKADAALSYGDVKRALLAVRDAGFGGAGLITTPRGKTVGA